MLQVRIVGPGRAGRSFAAALTSAGAVVELLERAADLSQAARGVDVVLIATPDRVIAQVSDAIVAGDAAVLHCSGATGLAPLERHARYGSIHPLMALPSPEIGAARLANNGWFAVAGDAVTTELVALLGGRSFTVEDDKRALYHATAAISANHLVALLGHVERLATQAGVPVQAFLDMAETSLGDVMTHGAAAALTGPAARGDWATLTAHRAALPPDELALYDTLASAAQVLAGTRSQDAGAGAGAYADTDAGVDIGAGAYAATDTGVDTGAGAGGPDDEGTMCR